MHYIVVGQNKLKGELPVYGSKNCALALLGASVLTDDSVVLNNCPQIADVENMLKILQAMGKKICRRGQTVTVWGETATTEIPQSLSHLLRGSGLLLGGLVGRFHHAFLPSTGGCAIGARPMDIHLDGLKAMGVEIVQSDGTLCVGKPVGTSYTLRFPSVGATENLVCAAVLAQGQTVLCNVALEPEVVSLLKMLNQMGAKISGIGSKNVIVTGVKRLHGTEFDVIPDRIVAATYLSCALSSLSELTITDCCPKHLSAFLDVISLAADVKIYSDAIGIRAACHPKSYGSVATAPYPFFPTDMQQLLLSLCAQCDGGVSFLTENLFENRLQHNARQLNRMGANISVCGNKATVLGQKLFGADVSSADLRGGAALVVAALGAQGVTTVHNAQHISRGYSHLAEQLRSVGADIEFFE